MTIVVVLMRFSRGSRVCLSPAVVQYPSHHRAPPAGHGLADEVCRRSGEKGEAGESGKDGARRPWVCRVTGAAR
jgi:hypothetical protein